VWPGSGTTYARGVGFLVSRRWAMFAIVVVVLGYGCYLLGRWQFHRLHDRETTNAQVRHNLSAAPTPVDDVLAAGRPAHERDEWRRVTATGTYLPDKSVVIRYQTRDGASGVDIVTPLETRSGTDLLVDRGWMRTDNVGSAKVDAPAPPPGTVTVVGHVRVDATGDATTVTDGSARAISSTAIARSTGLDVYGGFLDAEKETPAPDKALVKAELPDLGNGPHFFYGLQWWFFGLLALFGFCYLAWDERRKLRSPAGRPSQGPEHPSVDSQHHAGDEARSR
jgi:cytochrome oxidase assembly protein ShyY1